jgi:hypothetical protein
LNGLKYAKTGQNTLKKSIKMSFDNTTTYLRNYEHEVLLSHYVTEQHIILIYKQISMITSHIGNSDRVVKKTYSRFDGSMTEVFGKIIPAQNETYSFEE